jgi:hypothetical protein
MLENRFTESHCQLEPWAVPEVIFGQLDFNGHRGRRGYCDPTGDTEVDSARSRDIKGESRACKFLFL